MSYTYWKIEHTPFSSGTWDTSSTTELSSFNRPLVRVNTGKSKDSFQFTVTNNSLIDDSTLNKRDRVTIYRTVNTDTVTTDDILMTGTIQEAKKLKDFSKDVYKVKGNNYSESVLEAITFVDLENESIPIGIKKAIEQVGGSNNNFTVSWKDTNPTVKQSAGNEGDAFPNVGKRFFYKPLKKIIEEHSSPNKTEDGRYFYYVNTQNEFVWFHKDSTSQYSFDETTDNYKKLTVGMDKSGIKNYVIAKGGLDPANNPIQTWEANWSSIANNGIKFHILNSETNTAKTLVDLDKGGTTTNDSFPDITNSSFETKWIASYTATVDGVSVTKGSTVTIDKGNESDNKKAYTQILKQEIKTRLKKEAEDYLNLRANGVLQIDIEVMAGQKDWFLGDRIQTSIPSVSEDVKELRIVDIQYGLETDTFSLEEDEGTQ